MIEEISNYIISIVGVGGGVTVILYFLFKYLIRNIIDKKFDEKLASYRNTLAKDFEEYRFNLNSSFNRISKIHEKEFEVLPILWGKLQTVYEHLKGFMLPIPDEPVGLSKFSTEDLKAAIKNSEFSELYKIELMKETDLIELYKKYLFRNSFDPFYKSTEELSNFIAKNKIFFDSELNENLAILKKLFEDLILKFNEREKVEFDREQLSDYINIQEKIDSTFENIENYIKRKLSFVVA